MLYLTRLTAENLALIRARHNLTMRQIGTVRWSETTWELWRMAARLLESHAEVNRLLSVYEAEEAARFLWRRIESAEPGEANP